MRGWGAGWGGWGLAYVVFVAWVRHSLVHVACESLHVVAGAVDFACCRSLREGVSGFVSRGPCVRAHVTDHDSASRA